MNELERFIDRGHRFDCPAFGRKGDPKYKCSCGYEGACVELAQLRAVSERRREDLEVAENKWQTLCAGNADLKRKGLLLCNQDGELLMQNHALRSDLTDVKSRNEIFEGCLHRALKLWQAKYPKEKFWPDGAVNLAWVFDRLTEAEAIIREVGMVIVEGRMQPDPKWLSRCYAWLDGLDGTKP